MPVPRGLACLPGQGAALSDKRQDEDRELRTGRMEVSHGAAAELYECGVKVARVQGGETFYNSVPALRVVNRRSGRGLDRFLG